MSDLLTNLNCLLQRIKQTSAAVEELTFSLDELDLAESNVLVEC